MNVDFLAVGGTAWTVAGAMIVACMKCPCLHQRLADNHIQMERHGLELHYSRSYEMPSLQVLPRRPFDELHAMSLNTCFG